jgi:hypothetical protein
MCVYLAARFHVGRRQWADGSGRTAVGGQQWADSSGLLDQVTDEDISITLSYQHR